MELLRALGAFAEPPTREHAQIAELLGLPAPTPEEYTDTFVFQFYPYASVYLGTEGMLGGDARDRIAGFWRALGITPPAEPDHIAALLSLYASIAESVRTETDSARALMWQQARATLLDEYLVSWLPVYCARMREVATRTYARWAELVTDVLAHECGAAHIWREPAALRAIEPFTASDDDSLDALIAALLAPARSGIIIVRSDLERAARELQLGLRAGERRYALKSLLQQDAARVVEWLAEQAARQGAMHSHAADAGDRSPITDHAFLQWWARRAQATAAALAHLAPYLQPAQL
jgi:TorA maturation chaperone TorD